MIDLKDRWVTKAGVVVCDPDSETVLRLIASSKFNFKVTHPTHDINRFNEVSSVQIDTISHDDFILKAPRTVIPLEFASIDVDQYVFDLAKKQPGSKATIFGRVHAELQWLEDHGKYDLIRTLIYIISTLRNNSIPWGVGRGSAVNSYVLFLIGVHDIDSIKYDLNWREFMRE